jgi:hypothetical protein
VVQKYPSLQPGQVVALVQVAQPVLQAVQVAVPLPKKPSLQVPHMAAPVAILQPAITAEHEVPVWKDPAGHVRQLVANAALQVAQVASQLVQVVVPVAKALSLQVVQAVAEPQTLQLATQTAAPQVPVAVSSQNPSLQCEHV